MWVHFWLDFWVNVDVNAGDESANLPKTDAIEITQDLLALIFEIDYSKAASVRAASTTSGDLAITVSNTR